jgi:hypothetical protein
MGLWSPNQQLLAMPSLSGQTNSGHGAGSYQKGEWGGVGNTTHTHTHTHTSVIICVYVYRCNI